MKLTVEKAAKLLAVDKLTIRYLLDSGSVSWGVAIRKPKSKRTQYIIFPEKFSEATGIKLDNRDTFV